MLKKIILAAVALALIGVGTAFYLWNKPHETVDGKKGVEITATALAQAYAANEQQANTTYLNKVIEVTGRVSETEQDQGGGLMIVLETGDPMAGVQCAMREKGLAVTQGQQLTVKGFCSGNNITGVSLTDCIIKQ